jgi:uncharacterized protein (TIGR01244 family)
MDVLNYREFANDLCSAGQPSAEQWAQLRDAGVSHVLNIRPNEELPGINEEAQVHQAGMQYAHLPIASADSLTAEAVDELAAHIAQVRSGKLLIHCGSGNRVGALLALYVHRYHGASIEEAIAYGQRAGLTGLEPTVRQLLLDIK